MSVETYYRALFEQRRAIVEAGIADTASFEMHVRSHNFLNELDAFTAIINGSENDVFLVACREYQFALEAVLSGRYRHAYSSLRLTLELLLSTVFFSAHQLKLKLWLNGADDLNWSSLMDADKGVFSHNFLRAFYPELGSLRTQYMTLATTVYRECSEYVHGNPNTHESEAGEIKYEADRFRDFHDKVETVRLCVLFAMIIRYLPILTPDDRTKVEHIILDAFGSVPEIQTRFEVPNE